MNLKSANSIVFGGMFIFLNQFLNCSFEISFGCAKPIQLFREVGLRKNALFEHGKWKRPDG